MKHWIVGALCAVTFACGDAPPTVSVIVGQAASARPISELSRLRLLVRACAEDQLAIAEDLPVTPGGRPRFEAAVPPGEVFYVWLQGWAKCEAGVACLPEGQAEPSDCTCVGDDAAPAQILVSEACSGWLRTSEVGAQLSLTLNSVERGLARLCPPARPADCSALR